MIVSESHSEWPTPPSTLPELIVSLGSGNTAERIVAAHVLEDMGPKAESAIPALIANLDYDYSDVREAAARALGSIGSAAKSAAPQLSAMLLNDTDSVNARRAAAYALGRIGDLSAIPALAEVLNEDQIDNVVGVESAKSIAILVNQKFPDSNSTSFSLDVDGVPLIVKAAKAWWLNEGQYQNWAQP
jgi:HEAT repeat protein